MLDLNSIAEYLKSSISEKRYVHSYNVCAVAVELAEHYGLNTLKAGIAGLVHDCARELDRPSLMSCLTYEDISADNVALEVEELLHGPAAVNICRSVFGIEDEDILNAVRYHTTGRESMSLLEKIIYLADFIEPARSFDGVEELRKLAFVDMDRAVLRALDMSIQYIITKNGLIHIDTILSRNKMIIELHRK